MLQEIFNKVEQNQLQRTRNVVYFLDDGKNTFEKQSRNELWDTTHW